MNSEIKRAEVTEIINDIKKHSDRLSEYDNVPLLELSAILSKINRLHETTVILKYLTAREHRLEEVEFSQNRLFRTSIGGEVKSETPNVSINMDGGTQSTELEEGEEIIVEMDVDESEDSAELEDGEEIIVEMEVDNISEEEEEASDEEKKIIQQTLNKEQIENTPDLNEQYSEEKDNSISKQLQEQAIADLVSSIGLNERYLYANELFDGNLDDFKSSLNHINELENLNEANSYFWEELGEKFGWEKENELVKALYSLVERRFI